MATGTPAGDGSRAAAGREVLAGLTVAAMLVPQAMAYALLAGLPPEVGLYASTLPLVLYAVLGTSRQLAVGPVAIVSLLTATAVARAVPGGGGEVVVAAAVLALLVGAIHLVLGGLRLGFLVRLLSHPVLVGFTAAAAVIIATSQVRHLLGVDVPRSDLLVTTLSDLVLAVPAAHVPTVVVGAGSIAGLLAVRRWAPRVPGALVVVVVGTVVSTTLDLAGRGVAVVGTIPAGLPTLGLPSDLGLVPALLPAALVITLVGFMESIAVARVYARQSGDDLDANRELLALGAANLGAGLVGGYPVTGGLARTAVQADAGARTRWTGIVAAGAVLVVAAAFAPVFRSLPQATLAAIVVVAVTGLVDVDEARAVWRVRRSDFATLVVAFVATLAVGVEWGIVVAVAASLVGVAARIMSPHTAVLGCLPGTETWRNVERFPDARRVPGIEVIRFDVSLNYLNVEFLKQRVRRLVDAAGPDLSVVVFDAAGVNDVDVSAVEALVDLLDELGARGIDVHWADVKGPVRDVFARSGLQDRLGGLVHRELHEAMAVVTRAVPSSPQVLG